MSKRQLARSNTGQPAIHVVNPQNATFFDQRFINFLFIAEHHKFSSEEFQKRLMAYYINNVARTSTTRIYNTPEGQIIINSHSLQQLRRNCLNWFDRTTGRLIRKSIISAESFVYFQSLSSNLK